MHRLGSSVGAQDGGRGVQVMGGRHKFKRGGHSVNGGPDTKNEIHAPGVSTHARFTRRLGLF